MDYDDIEQTIDLPLTEAAWGAGVGGEDLENALEDEVATNVHKLPLDDFLDSGGWTDDEQVEIEGVEVTGNRLTASVCVYFTECIASGCSEMPHTKRRTARMTLTMERGKASATIERDKYDWDVADHNSANDGV